MLGVRSARAVEEKRVFKRVGWRREHPGRKPRATTSSPDGSADFQLTILGKEEAGERGRKLCEKERLRATAQAGVGPRTAEALARSRPALTAIFAACSQSKDVVLTVDALIIDEAGLILLLQHGHAPFQGSWVLPGGVEVEETVEQACARMVEEE